MNSLLVLSLKVQIADWQHVQNEGEALQQTRSVSIALLLLLLLHTLQHSFDDATSDCEAGAK